VKQVQLHGVLDACEKAYAEMVYSTYDYRMISTSLA